MAFVVLGAKPFAILEESHRCQLPPLDGSIAEGMAVRWLLEAMANGNFLCKWEQAYLGEALPESQSHRELYRGTLKGAVRLCEHCSFVGFSNQGHGLNCFSKEALHSKRLGASHV